MNKIEGKTSFKLKEVKTEYGEGVAKYSLKHITSGSSGTTLEEEVVVNFSESGVKLSINFSDCESGNIEDGLDKLSSWLKRISQSIDERDKSKSLPI